MPDDTNKNVSEDKSKLPQPPKGKKTMAEIKITMDEFCGSLPRTGVDQFAKVRMECRMSEWGEENKPRTRPEWEALYLRVQES